MCKTNQSNWFVRYCYIVCLFLFHCSSWYFQLLCFMLCIYKKIIKIILIKIIKFCDKWYLLYEIWCVVFFLKYYLLHQGRKQRKAMQAPAYLEFCITFLTQQYHGDLQIIDFCSIVFSDKKQHQKCLKYSYSISCYSQFFIHSCWDFYNIILVHQHSGTNGALGHFCFWFQRNNLSQGSFWAYIFR